MFQSKSFFLQLIEFILRIVNVRSGVQMPRGTMLSDAQKATVVQAIADGLSRRAVASLVGKSANCINNFVSNRYKKNPVMRGPKPKISSRMARKLRRSVSNKVVSVSQLEAIYGLEVCNETVRKCLNNCPWLEVRKMVKGQLMSSEHMALRVSWAIPRMPWTFEWRNVIFSDEKRFNLDGPDGNTLYWHDTRKPELHFRTRQSGGGSVMIWAASGYSGRSALHFVQGI